MQSPEAEGCGKVLDDNAYRIGNATCNLAGCGKALQFIYFNCSRYTHAYVHTGS